VQINVHSQQLAAISSSDHKFDKYFATGRSVSSGSDHVASGFLTRFSYTNSSTGHATV
jgi:hypothetical protein